MTKPLIAIDIDEVLAATTDALRIYVNETTGHNLTAEHYQISAPYWGYYETVWSQNGIEELSLIHAYHRKMMDNQDDIQPVIGAVEAVRELMTSYRLMAITSREAFMEDETKRWLQRHFGNAFEEVVFLGHGKLDQRSKGMVCSQAGVRVLVDDNFEHCESAVEANLDAIVFGEYGWHQHDFDVIPGAPDWSTTIRMIHERLSI